MNPERTERRLAAAAMVFRCLMWFPVWMLLLSLRQSGAVNLLPCCGILLAAACVTAFWSRYWKLRHRGLYPVRTGFLIALVLLPLAAGASWLLMRLSGGVVTIVLAVGVTLLVSALTAHKEPDMLFAPPVYGTYLALTAAAVLMLTFAHVSVPMTLVLAVTCVESGGFFLLRNQFTLRRLVNRRSLVETDVPRGIKRMNLLLAGGMFALLLVLFLCRVPLLGLLQWMERAALVAVRAVLFAINWLIGRFGGDAPESDERPAGSADPSLLESIQDPSPLWLLLWVPVLYVVFRLGQEWLSDVREWLAVWLRGRRAQYGNTAAPDEKLSALGYVDTETRTEQEPTDRQKRRSWRKEVRAWQRLPDGEEKFFAGYALLLRAPAWQGELPREADTVREVCAQWQAAHGTELDAVTADFQGVRYAGAAFSAGNLADMTGALEAVAAMKN